MTLNSFYICKLYYLIVESFVVFYPVDHFRL